MYCNIYQISDSPIDSGDYINAVDFLDHWFVGEIAECVDEVENPDDERRILRERLEENQVAIFDRNGSFAILPNGKENYFKGAFDRFCKALREIESKALTDFSNDGPLADWVDQLNGSFCDKFGNYVVLDDFELIPFDEFIRSADRRKGYYLGAVLRYKY